MKLENEVKQEKFANEHQKAIINILFTGGWMSSMSIASLKPFGVSPEQFNVLRILRGQYPKPVTLGLIQERMLDRMSNATRLVEKLKQKELVDRRECSYNRRQVDIVITQKGLNLLAVIQPHLEENIPHSIKTLTEEEAAKLNQLLDKLRG
jgi:DNA-binding MarR family transcriptional regulator